MTGNTFSDDEIIDALTAAGVPENIHSVFTRFQKVYGGREDAFGLNQVTWGVIHRSPLYLPPMKIEAEFDEETNLWHIWCADVHPSDTMTIDKEGRLYWSFFLRYNHYEHYFRGEPPLDWETDHKP